MSTIQSFNRLALSGYRLQRLEVRSESWLRLDLSGVAVIKGRGRVLEECALLFGEVKEASVELDSAVIPLVVSANCQRGKIAGTSVGRTRSGKSGTHKPSYLFQLEFDIGQIVITAATFSHCVTKSLLFSPPGG